MAKKVEVYVAELIQAYERCMDKTYSEVALDFDITISNLYRYRKGDGNPKARTVDKIIAAVEENCPELLRREEDNRSG